LASIQLSAQHFTQLTVVVNNDEKKLTIDQQIEFFNETNDTLSSIVLNDWNNAYSNKKSPLSKKFSDEFYDGFQFANKNELGRTFDISISNNNKTQLTWTRPEKFPDVIIVNLGQKLNPGQKIKIHLNYNVKIPNDKFTKFGYNNKGDLNLKNWFLCPSRYTENGFITYNNFDLDDIANALTDFEITLKVDKNKFVISDLNDTVLTKDDFTTTYLLNGKNRTEFSLVIEQNSSYNSFKTNAIQVISNLSEKNVLIENKSKAIERIVNFTNKQIGKFPHQKIVVSQIDYDRNPFYGLSQIPSILRPFENEFIYEIKFLKTYLNEYLKKSMQLDPRKDHWIFDGIQVYTMMKYIETYYPDMKMLGSTYKYFFLKSYSLAQVDFNDQFSYLYLIMARKNLDQPLSTPKDSLIKFNEKIAMKYRAGLSLKYLDDYLENNYVNNSIQQFYFNGKDKKVATNDFENILKANSNKNIDWFFKTLIDTRKLIDYKLTPISKTKDSLTFSIKSKTEVKVPVPIYGIKNDEIVYKKWFENSELDSTFTIEKNKVDKLVINYKNEVPEINANNNTYSLTNPILNRPIKFSLVKDIEDPKYNQVLWVPEFGYNYYDGLIVGISLHNRAFLEKKFNYKIIPSYSIKSNSLTGFSSIIFNQNIREGSLYNIKYSNNTSYFFYAPDATYLKLNPMVQFNFREDDFRSNRNRTLLAREVIVRKEKSEIVLDSINEAYAVFDVRYFDAKFEGLNHYKFMSDIQLSSDFGKVSVELGYRKRYINNRQITLRAFAGTFLYNQTTETDYFSFAIDRPTDYLFDYNYLGRSQTSGIFSQQYIVAEGGFKSFLNPAYANQWIVTFNANYTLWNWIEVYGDVGFAKNKNQNAPFLYDSGICFDLVNNYFEIYFPIYSNNGWEIAQPNYSEKIRFLITLSTNKLFTLFTRKWF
jgi:hypothetical protein